MPASMPYDKTRQKMIRAHMRDQEDSAGGVERLPHEKLIVKGQAVRAPIYCMSLDDLAFNKANGRIKSEVLEKEAELGRLLEPSVPEDQKIIKEILLSIRPDENEKISEDLRKNGQLRTGIITCDGIVINGNRRKAILAELHRSTGDNQFKYLDVQVLPCDITKAELWLIEAGIQLSAPQQLDYSPINHLLKLREGVSSGLNIHDMAARIYGVSEDTLKSDLERLDLIDEYLRDFLRKAERYYLVKRLNEHFIDLHEILSWAKRPRGKLINWQPDASDKNELKLVAFFYIRLGFAHLRIREMRDLFATEESWREVKRALEVQVELSEEERQSLGLQSEPESLEDEDSDTGGTEGSERAPGFTTAVEDRDFKEEASWREAHKEDLHDFYEDAKEQERNVKDSQKPMALAKRALKAIEAIPQKRESLLEPEMDDIFRQIITRVNDLRKLIQKHRAKKTTRTR